MDLLQSAYLDYRNGEAARARQRCSQWLHLHPEDARALALLGALLGESQEHAAAAGVFRRLIALEPHQASHWANLGTAARAQGDYDEALNAYEEAARRGAAGNADFLLNLALLHLDRLETGKAHALLRQAQNLAPDKIQVRVMAAVAAFETADDETARRSLLSLESELAKAGDLDSDLLLRACTVLMQIGAHALAERLLRMLTTAHPQDRLVTVRFAQLLERCNRVDDAEAMLLALSPEPPPSGELAEDWLAVRARLAERRREFASAEQGYRELLGKVRVEALAHHVRFPLARCLAAQERHDEAMAEFARAHASQMQFLERAAGHLPRSAFSIADHGTDPQDLAAWTDPGAPDAAASPIFIVGFPRSGTTLLEQMLDAHPALQAMDEQPFLQNAIDHLSDAGLPYPASLAAARPEHLQAARAHYHSRVAAALARDPARRLVDKNPLNLLRLPGLVRLFPNARIVLAIRHPCDVILSCYQQHFRAPEFASLCAEPERLARAYVRAFDFWFAESAKLAPAVHELRYESLVSDFETEARKLAHFLDLPWDQAMLDPAHRARQRGYISTPSYAQVTEAVHRASVQRWRAYEKHLGGVRAVVRPYLKRWAYEP